jgi:hypothetical protein
MSICGKAISMFKVANGCCDCCVLYMCVQPCWGARPGRARRSNSP